jgi:AcrR family transcriptional regulator
METNARPAPSRRGRPRSFDRDAALDRALDVFRRLGYEGASIGDLTGAMGIHPPSLYAAFGDKEGLFRAAVARYVEGPGSAAVRILAEEPDARRAVERLLRETADGLTSRGSPRGCLVALAGVNCSEEARPVAEAMASLRAASEGRLRARIERGIRDGDLAPGSDARALAGFYFTVLQGMSLRARDGASRASLRATADAAMAAWPARRRPPARARAGGRRPRVGRG